MGYGRPKCCRKLVGKYLMSGVEMCSVCTVLASCSKTTLFRRYRKTANVP